MPNNSFKTAIKRIRPSAPMSWLASRGLLQGRCLDYGCGRGFDVNHFGIEGFDPHFKPVMPDGKFDTICCNYVLNVIDTPEDRQNVLESILRILEPDGCAYIAIRRDIKQEGYTSKGTYQENVELDLPIIRQVSGYVIYQLKGDLK